MTNIYTQYRVVFNHTESVESQWVQTEAEAKNLVKSWLANNPNKGTASYKAWEFYSHPEKKIVQELSAKCIHFVIKELDEYFYIETGQVQSQEMEGRYTSLKEAQEAIQEYLKTPFNYQGFPYSLMGQN